MPYLSIIMPVYNTAAHGMLCRAIESILNQTFDDFELILVDDGSTDESPQLIDSYAASDMRIVAIHKQNQGCYAAYNDALNKANGIYVTFFGSDDYADKEMYAVLCTLCRKYQLDYLLTVPIFEHCDVDGNIYSTLHPVEMQEDVFYEQEQFRQTYELYKNFKAGNVHLYRRALIGDLRLQTRHFGEDCIFNLRFVPRVRRAMYSIRPLYHHCIYDMERYNLSINKFDANMNLLFSERFTLAKKNLMDWNLYHGESRHIVARRRMDELLLQYRLLDAPSCRLTCKEKKEVAVLWIDDAVIEAAFDLYIQGELSQTLARSKYRQLEGGNPKNRVFEGVMVGILSKMIPSLCDAVNTKEIQDSDDIRQLFMETVASGIKML